MVQNPEFGSRRCVCQKCGLTVAHEGRGVPCTDLRCPECGAAMRGEHCDGGTVGDTRRPGGDG